MATLKGLQRLGLASLAVAALASGGSIPSAHAAALTPVPAGACTGNSTTTDCVTATGHISASVVGTLSINEVRGVSFGDYAFSGASDGTGTVVLDYQDNSRTIDPGTADTIIGMHGAGATPAGNAASGGQSYGVYHVSGGEEDATGTTGVYISFYTSGGEPLNICDHDGTGCDTLYAAPTNPIKLDASTPSAAFFTVDNFSFNEDGKDVFGHYINTTGGEVDVKVGATMHTEAQTYTAGAYRGTFNINVSY